MDLRERRHGHWRRRLVRRRETDWQNRGPGADATVYRWSGSVWVKKGTVDRVPLSLDYYRASSGGWFEAVTVTGTAVPGFIMEGATSPARAVLSDAGGSWHVARFTPSRTS